ncbi:hypothetical protein O508_02518 [Staphylococcus aureus M0413]|nr:hypothetical protein O508_02518 [Staphylococcus aureus M0413]
MNQQLIETLKSKEGKMIEIRRYLHQHPELSFHEDETAKYIAEFYKGKDVEVETNVGPRGIKVTIDSGKPGKTLAIRETLTHYPLLKIQDYLLHHKIKVLCTHVVTMHIQHICLY